MAKLLKIKLFPISTDTDLATLEEFLSSVKTVDHVTEINDKVLVIYEEEID